MVRFSLVLPLSMLPLSPFLPPSLSVRVCAHVFAGGYGDLIIHFDVQYPTSLRPEQKMLLKTGKSPPPPLRARPPLSCDSDSDTICAALALPKTLTEEQQTALTSVKNAFAFV